MLPGSKVFYSYCGSHLCNYELSLKLKQQNWYILFLNNNQRTTFSSPGARPQDVLNILRVVFNPFDRREKHFLLLEANMVDNIFNGIYLKRYADIKRLWWCVSYVREKNDDKILRIRIFTKNIKKVISLVFL